MAGITTKVLVTQHEAIETGPHGLSYGELVNAHLATMVQAGQQVFSVELHFSEEDQQQLYAMYNKDMATPIYPDDTTSNRKATKRAY